MLSAAGTSYNSKILESGRNSAMPVPDRRLLDTFVLKCITA
jgi:hypothetical protein